MYTGDLLEIIVELPIIIQTKIISYYIRHHFKDTQMNYIINDLNDNIILKDLNLITYFQKRINNNGYIRMEEFDFKIINQRFPNVVFSNISDKQIIRKMVEDCWRQLKFYYKKIHILPGSPSNYNVYLAGGFFTNYISKTSPYIQEFKQYFQYFDENKDVDLYYTNRRSKLNNESSDYDNFYIKIKEYQNKFNLVPNKAKNPEIIISSFDFDLCKIFYSYDHNEIYVHRSLIFSISNINMPSFFNIKLDQLDMKYNSNCVCIIFKRNLKYFMKGFNNNDIHNDYNEIKRAKQIEKEIIDAKTFQCKYCFKSMFYEKEIL